MHLMATLRHPCSPTYSHQVVDELAEQDQLLEEFLYLFVSKTSRKARKTTTIAVPVEAKQAFDEIALHNEAIVGVGLCRTQHWQVFCHDVDRLVNATAIKAENFQQRRVLRVAVVNGTVFVHIIAMMRKGVEITTSDSIRAHLHEDGFQVV